VVLIPHPIVQEVCHEPVLSCPVLSCLALVIQFLSPFIYLFTVVTGGQVYILDLAAKLDQCADFVCKQLWGEVDFPPPFGREAYPEVSSPFTQPVGVTQ